MTFDIAQVCAIHHGFERAVRRDNAAQACDGGSDIKLRGDFTQEKRVPHGTPDEER